MRGRSKLLTFGAALPTVVLLGHGCRTATQVTIDIGTNVVCADMHGVDIVIAGDSHDAEHRAALDVPGTRFATTTTSDCTEGAPPRKVGTLALTPSSGGGAVVLVAAFGATRVADCVAPNFGPGCIVARRRFGFVDHMAVTLPIVLDPVCAGVPCNESSTCVGKKCVDSSVDCTSGTCADPGQRSADGGLVEVDAFSPLDSSGGTDASDAAAADGADSAGSDGASGDGSTGDGGADAGGGSCPMSTICAAPAARTCVGGAAFGGPSEVCCYVDPTQPTCTTLGMCAAISGCCRSADDCLNGDICCASTPTPMTSTVIQCKPRSACATGTVVCASPGMGGCGPGHACPGGRVYSSAPDYYGCS
jgi:hypothetical protein